MSRRDKIVTMVNRVNAVIFGISFAAFIVLSILFIIETQGGMK